MSNPGVATRCCLFVLLVLLLAGCAGRNAVPRGYTETGMASWYGKKFHGRLTANGERYNMDALTAAHPKLPFGTVVRVTSLDNGRSVVVRINDRGPFKKGRIIDLSRAAARKLHMIKRGVVKVRLEAKSLPGRHVASGAAVR